MPGDFECDPYAPGFVLSVQRELEQRCRALFSEVSSLEYQLDDQKAEREVLKTGIDYFEGLSRALQALTPESFSSFQENYAQLTADIIEQSEHVKVLRHQVERLEAQIDQNALKLPSPELSSLVQRRKNKSKRALLSIGSQGEMELEKVISMLTESLNGLGERKKDLSLANTAVGEERADLGRRFSAMISNQQERLKNEAYRDSNFGKFEALYLAHRQLLHQKQGVEKEVVQLKACIDQLGFQLEALPVRSHSPAGASQGSLGAAAASQQPVVEASYPSSLWGFSLNHNDSHAVHAGLESSGAVAAGHKPAEQKCYPSSQWGFRVFQSCVGVEKASDASDRMPGVALP